MIMLAAAPATGGFCIKYRGETLPAAAAQEVISQAFDDVGLSAIFSICTIDPALQTGEEALTFALNVTLDTEDVEAADSGEDLAQSAQACIELARIGQALIELAETRRVVRVDLRTAF